MKFKCPACNRFIYNRKVIKCEFCGNDLPKDLLLTEEQHLALYKKSQALSKKSAERTDELGKIIKKIGESPS